MWKDYIKNKFLTHSPNNRLNVFVYIYFYGKPQVSQEHKRKRHF